MEVSRTNWAGNVRYSAERFHRPTSVGALQHLVSSSENIRALGTGHSFNTLADCAGDLVSLAGLPPLVQVDASCGSVTVAGGTRYGELAGGLQRAGLALANLGSLPHISVAGACATGTHGSGDRNGVLATAVSALEMVTAEGDLAMVSRQADPDQLRATVVGLGALGIVTRLTLDVEPTYDVQQLVYEGLTRDTVREAFSETFGGAYSVSAFTDWHASGTASAWLKHRVDGRGPLAPEPRWLGGSLADGPRHPVPGMPAAHCTGQMGEPAPWSSRLPHFRQEFEPSSGEELQSEYFVPRHLAAEALEALESIRERMAPVLQVCEIRTVAADDLWLSPCHGQEAMAIHFTWLEDVARVTAVLADVEERLEPFGARPHWGKLFGTGADTLRGLYPRWADFVDLRRRRDPHGKFTNDLLDRWLQPGAHTTGY